MPRDAREALASPVRIPIEHVTGLLMPIFFIGTGLTVDITGLGGSGIAQLPAVIGVACLGKLRGADTAARATGMSWSDSRAVGLLMNTRDLTELIILNGGVSLGVLDSRTFTITVIMALVTAAMAGLFIARQDYARPDGAFVADDPVLEAA